MENTTKDNGACQHETLVMQRGDKIWVEPYKRPFTVQVANERYAICTRPAFGSGIYFIADFEERVRGTENLIFGLGAETVEQCEDMLNRLTNGMHDGFKTEISHRNRVELVVKKIERCSVA
jgi:hypothetical protein